MDTEKPAHPHFAPEGGSAVRGVGVLVPIDHPVLFHVQPHLCAGGAGKVAAGFGLVYLAAGLWAASVQPAIVKSMLVTPPAGYEFYKYFGFAGYVWLALVAVAVLVAAIARRSRQI